MIFPSLCPSARTWTPGAPVTSNFVSSSGYEVRILQGAAVVGQQLMMTFQNLPEDDARKISDHYAAVQGVYGLFELPGAVFGGMTSFGWTKPSANSWRYAAPPSLEFVSPGRVSVGVSLVAVPK